MARLQKYKEHEICMRHIKKLVAVFERTKFKISDIECIGGTERGLVAEGPLFKDQVALLETLNDFQKCRFIKFIDYNQRKMHTNEFEVIIDNIGEIKPFRTHNDIINEMRNLSDDTFGINYPGVRAHLNNAEKILFDKGRDDYSEVGHYCQLAYQDFLESACKKLGIDTAAMNRDKTNERFKEIVSKFRELEKSEKEIDLLEALQHYWGCSNDFNEKVEHRGVKANSKFEEAKKGFLYTFLVIIEIERFLDQEGKS